MEFIYKKDYKIREAENFEANGKILHAIQLYQSIINENPDVEESYIKLAELYENIGKIGPAVNLLESYLELNYQNNEVRLYLGRFLLRNALFNEAIDTLAFILSDEVPLAYFYTGYAYFILKDYEPAAICFRNFISSEKDHELLHECYVYLAKTEIELKNYNSALVYAEKAIVLYSDLWELYQLSAAAYFNLGMHTHAINPIEKAIKLNPRESSSYELAGKIYFETGDFQKAKKNLLLFIDSTEITGADTYIKLAETCLRIENLKEALTYFDLALSVDPQNKSAASGKKKTGILLKKKASDG